MGENIINLSPYDSKALLSLLNFGKDYLEVPLENIFDGVVLFYSRQSPLRLMGKVLGNPEGMFIPESWFRGEEAEGNDILCYKTKALLIILVPWRKFKGKKIQNYSYFDLACEVAKTIFHELQHLKLMLEGEKDNEFSPKQAEKNVDMLCGEDEEFFNLVLDLVVNFLEVNRYWGLIYLKENEL